MSFETHIDAHTSMSSVFTVAKLNNHQSGIVVENDDLSYDLSKRGVVN